VNSVGNEGGRLQVSHPCFDSISWIHMFLTGSHKVGLMGLVLVPSSTLKTEMEIR